MGYKSILEGARKTGGATPFAICAAIAFGLLPVHSLRAQAVHQLVVFGDSLSDNGNAAAALASIGQTTGNYAVNAFTDGPNTIPATSGPFGLWIDQFAARAGLPDPQPFLVDAPLGPSSGVLSVNPSATNFAVASALAGNNANFSPTDYLNPANPQVPGTTNQVALFLSFRGPNVSSEDMYVFWAGANNIYQLLGNQSSLFTYPVVAKNAADSIAKDIATLAKAGGKHFLWLNLPPLGHVPFVNDNANFLIRELGPAAGDSAALIFNDELAVDAQLLEGLYGINIVVVNTNSLFNSIVRSPAKYGFVDVKDAAWCGADDVKNCATHNPNTFLFWDELHPTTAANQILAEFAYSYVAGQL